MYTREYKSDFSAKWICASDTYLKSFDRPKSPSFQGAKFIWGRRYTRAYFRRLFDINKKVVNAYLHILCDNIFDVYVNGKNLVCEKKDSGLVDITESLVAGENLLMIRAYQTATPNSFTSALTGGIRIEYTDGTSEEIVTDESFENVRFIDFWETEEPKDWYLDKKSNRETRNQLIVTDMHAIAIKRSCFFKKDFDLSKEVKKATLLASAMGCYEPHLNGKRVDEIYFCPSSSDSVKEYQSFDVTNCLSVGENRLSAIMGNGWYNCESWGALLANKPALLMELSIEYCDGTEEKICTDSSWQVCASPLADNDIQFGERYIASMEIEGWDSPSCKGGDWTNADELQDPKFTNLVRQNYPPIRATKRFSAKLVKRLEDGSALFDCGINVAGAVELKIRSPKAGQMITIAVSERLNEQNDLEIGAYVAPYYPQDSRPDGNAPYNLRNTNIYFAKGDETEYYSPRFCYTGFRYIKISGIEANEEDITVREMHNDLKVVGSFVSADKTLTDLWKATTQTWVNNCYNGPTDCPTREKNFWTGDTMIFSHLACWYTDCEAFLSRWTDLGRKMTGPYGWEDETYMLPWILYRFYGDIEILKIRYRSICGFVSYRINTANGKPLPENPYSCYNDWLNPTGQNLSPSFFSHCWYLKMLDVASQIAEVLGDTENQKLWREKFEQGKAHFNKLYYNAETGEYSEKIQSSAVLPLAFGLVPDGEEQKVADTLHRYLKENSYKLTTGFQASRHILEVLSDYGYGDDAIKLLHQDEFPSWKYMLDSGATNITESWLAMNDPDRSISMCHFSLAGSFSWFFEYLGGIKISESSAGLERIVLEPHCFEKLGACAVRYNTKFGEIVSQWRFENGELSWNYSVPEGIQVEVRNPRVYKLQEV